jgi:hypothetical protein
LATPKKRSPETLQERRERQAIEGAAAMKEYRAREVHLVKATARLRAERLVRETEAAKEKPQAPAGSRKRKG